MEGEIRVKLHKPRSARNQYEQEEEKSVSPPESRRDPATWPCQHLHSSFWLSEL
jgi:hypothetical protein